MPAPQITPLPTPPSRSQSPATFSADADAFLGALPEFQSDANTQANYLDGLANNVTDQVVQAEAAVDLANEAAAVAISAANYKGEYNPATTYQVGQSVSYEGRRYAAKTVNTGVTPVDGANWFLINDGDVLGPQSSVDGGLAAFDGTTGKFIKAAGTVTAEQGGTGLTSAGDAGNILTSDGTNWISAAPPSNAVNYPQNIQSADYTLVLDDAGKMIFHPASDTITRTFTIPSNASVAFPIGTVVMFTVENGGILVTVNITSDTLVFGSGETGQILVPPNNTLVAVKVTSTKWMANYLYQTGKAPTQSIAIGNNVSPRISVYPWSSVGFGTRFANPATLPPSDGYNVAFSPTGDAIAVAHSSSPCISVYPWSSAGFGTRFANPVTPPNNNAYGVAFSPAGDAIAVGHDASPFISVYPWSSVGFGTRFANPVTPPTGTGNGVAFSPTGDAIAVAHFGSPHVSAYPWSGATGFGVKFADPATPPAGTGNGVAFSPSGDAIAVAHQSSPNISAYPWSGSGFGTKFANPATLPTGQGNGVAFTPSGDAIAVGHFNAPFISVYPWSASGFGAKFPDPATPPTSASYSVAFSPAGDAIALAHINTPFVSAYQWNSSGFGARFANPATLPSGAGRGVAFTISK
jgi:WD40 repeat protein